MRAGVCPCVYMCVFTFVCVCVCACLGACMGVYMGVCLCVCVCVCVRVTSEKLAKTLGLPSDIGHIIRERGLRGLGHVARMNDTRLPKRALFGEMLIARHGPQKRWQDIIVDDLKVIHSPVLHHGAVQLRIVLNGEILLSSRLQVTPNATCFPVPVVVFSLSWRPQAPSNLLLFLKDKFCPLSLLGQGQGVCACLRLCVCVCVCASVCVCTCVHLRVIMVQWFVESIFIT